MKTAYQVQSRLERIRIARESVAYRRSVCTVIPHEIVTGSVTRLDRIDCERENRWDRSLENAVREARESAKQAWQANIPQMSAYVPNYGPEMNPDRTAKDAGDLVRAMGEQVAIASTTIPTDDRPYAVHMPSSHAEVYAGKVHESDAEYPTVRVKLPDATAKGAETVTMHVAKGAPKLKVTRTAIDTGEKTLLGEAVIEHSITDESRYAHRGTTGIRRSVQAAAKNGESLEIGEALAFPHYIPTYVAASASRDAQKEAREFDSVMGKSKGETEHNDILYIELYRQYGQRKVGNGLDWLNSIPGVSTAMCGTVIGNAWSGNDLFTTVGEFLKFGQYPDGLVSELVDAVYETDMGEVWPCGQCGKLVLGSMLYGHVFSGRCTAAKEARRVKQATTKNHAKRSADRSIAKLAKQTLAKLNYDMAIASGEALTPAMRQYAKRERDRIASEGVLAVSAIQPI